MRSTLSSAQLPEGEDISDDALDAVGELSSNDRAQMQSLLNGGTLKITEGPTGSGADGETYTDGEYHWIVINKAVKDENRRKWTIVHEWIHVKEAEEYGGSGGGGSGEDPRSNPCKGASAYGETAWIIVYRQMEYDCIGPNGEFLGPVDPECVDCAFYREMWELWNDYWWACTLEGGDDPTPIPPPNTRCP